MTNTHAPHRNPASRVKNHTGTVHFARPNGSPECAPVRTHAGWMRPTIEDVTCLRCIAAFGSDEPTDFRDPEPTPDAHVARRAAERAARQAARKCEGHPAGPYDPMGETVYCDGCCV